MKAIWASDTNPLLLPPVAAFDGAGGGVEIAAVDVDWRVALAAALGGMAGLDDLAAMPAGDDGVEGGHSGLEAGSWRLG